MKSGRVGQRAGATRAAAPSRRRGVLCRASDPGRNRSAPSSPLLERLGSGLVASLASAALVLLPGAIPEAQALGPVRVPLTDYHLEQTPCEKGTVELSRSFQGDPLNNRTDQGSSILPPKFQDKNGCFTVTAQADNPKKDDLRNADVFGDVFDGAGNSARDNTENIRLSYIAKIPPGKSTVTFKIIIPSVGLDSWESFLPPNPSLSLSLSSAS